MAQVFNRFIDKTSCRLPEVGEIAITDLTADIFLKYDHKNGDVITEINYVDDLIGLELSGYTICGVYSTEVDISEYREYWGEYTSQVDYEVNELHNSIANCCFLSEDEEDSQNFAMYSYMIKTSGDIKKDLEFVNTYEDDDIIRAYGINVSMLTTYNLIEDDILLVANWIAVVCVLVATLMMINYIMVSVKRQKKEFGILRALGASKKSIMTIFLSEVLCISFAQFILSLIGLGALCAIINSTVFFFNFILIGLIPVVGLFVFSFGITLLISILPIKQIVNKTPVEAVRDI